MADQVNETARVAEFVVVPGDQFHEVRVKRDATEKFRILFYDLCSNIKISIRSCVEDGRIGAAKEISRNNLKFSLNQI